MEIRRYIAIVQRWLWLIILGAILVGGVTYLINANTQPIYRASARLLIDQAPDSGANEYAQALFEERLTTTYVELIGLYPVMEETVRRLDLPLSANDLKDGLSISAPPQTQLIIISVDDTDPDRAALIANTVGEVFTDLNAERENARFAESIANYEQQMEAIQVEIADLETQIFALGEPDTAEGQAKLSQLETERREAQIRYTEAFNNREDLKVQQARSSNNLIPVEPARAPAGPISPRTMTNTLLGAAIGGMLALGLVLLLEYMDDTIKSSEQIMQIAELSTLGAIAQIKGSEPKERLVTHLTPRSPISEAFRVLRTNLSFSAIDEELRTLVITSSSPGEGKSTISANMAVVVAQTGKKVIVVDSDLRRPTQHKLFGLANNQGLTTALLDSDTPLQHHIQNTMLPGLRVLTSGPIPPNPAELLNSQRMNHIIEMLSEEADMVIFDTPPTLTVADAAILAPQTSGCLLVVNIGETRQHALAQAADRLRSTGANLFGAVMNQLKVGRSGYYYGYYRYYDYEYSQSGSRRRNPFRLPAWLSALGRRS